MRRLKVIGIGAGDPDFVTQQAVRALNEVDVFFLFDKGEDKDELIAVRKLICERFIEGSDYRFVTGQDPERDRTPGAYTAEIQDWHENRAEVYETLFDTELADGQCGAFLVWGDPMLYDSTLRVIDRMRERGIVDLSLEVIPGITSVQALAAAHAIPINGIGEPIHYTTGRRLAAGETGDAPNVVVMLDAHLVAKDFPDATIYWGAYLGLPDQLLISGKVSEVIDDIARQREELRTRKGWIMDTYVLRLPVAT